MLDEGLVHLLATDAHHPQRRPPLLAEGREAAARRVGDDEATHLVLTRPAGIVRNVEPTALQPVPSVSQRSAARPNTWRNWFTRRAG